jgi:hypothetical protein
MLTCARRSSLAHAQGTPTNPRIFTALTNHHQSSSRCGARPRLPRCARVALPFFVQPERHQCDPIHRGPRPPTAVPSTATRRGRERFYSAFSYTKRDVRPDRRSNFRFNSKRPCRVFSGRRAHLRKERQKSK